MTVAAMDVTLPALRPVTPRFATTARPALQGPAQDLIHFAGARPQKAAPQNPLGRFLGLLGLGLVAATPLPQTTQATDYLAEAAHLKNYNDRYGLPRTVGDGLRTAVDIADERGRMPFKGLDRAQWKELIALVEKGEGQLPGWLIDQILPADKQESIPATGWEKTPFSFRVNGKYGLNESVQHIQVNGLALKDFAKDIRNSARAIEWRDMADQARGIDPYSLTINGFNVGVALDDVQFSLQERDFNGALAALQPIAVALRNGDALILYEGQTPDELKNDPAFSAIAGNVEKFQELVDKLKGVKDARMDDGTPLLDTYIAFQSKKHQVTFSAAPLVVMVPGLGPEPGEWKVVGYVFAGYTPVRGTQEDQKYVRGTTGAELALLDAGSITPGAGVMAERGLFKTEDGLVRVSVAGAVQGQDPTTKNINPDGYLAVGLGPVVRVVPYDGKLGTAYAYANPSVQMNMGLKEVTTQCQGVFSRQGLTGHCDIEEGRSGPVVTAVARGGLGYIAPWGTEVRAEGGVSRALNGHGEGGEYPVIPFVAGQITQPLGFNPVNDLMGLVGEPGNADDASLTLHGGHQFQALGVSGDRGETYNQTYGGVRLNFPLN